VRRVKDNWEALRVRTSAIAVSSQATWAPAAVSYASATYPQHKQTHTSTNIAADTHTHRETHRQTDTQTHMYVSDIVCVMVAQSAERCCTCAHLQPLLECSLCSQQSRPCRLDGFGRQIRGRRIGRQRLGRQLVLDRPQVRLQRPLGVRPNRDRQRWRESIIERVRALTCVCVCARASVSLKRTHRQSRDEGTATWTYLAGCSASMRASVAWSSAMRLPSILPLSCCVAPPIQLISARACASYADCSSLHSLSVFSSSVSVGVRPICRHRQKHTQRDDDVSTRRMREVEHRCTCALGQAAGGNGGG
jgi:hypothetical protein